jgi:Tfp pilus assembly major pilin PilA
MRAKLKVLAACSAALFVARVSQAVPIAYDPFINGAGGYTAGAINTQNPSVFGFTGAWTSTSSANTVSATNSTHNSAIQTTGGSLAWTGTSSTSPDRGATRSLASYTASASDTYYFSLTASRGTWTGTTNNEEMAGFTDSTVTSGTFKGFQFGFRRVGATATDPFLSIRAGGTTTDVFTQSTFGRTFLAIFKLEKDVNGTEDRLSYWIAGQTSTLNSTLNTSSEATINASTPTASRDAKGVLTGQFISGKTDITQFSIHSPTASGAITWDELRMGTEYADVAPEPGCLAFLGLAFLGLGSRRRAKRA